MIFRILFDMIVRLLPGYDKMPYRKYLQTAAWKNRRQLVFYLYGKKCKRCGRELFIQVHHKTYKHRGYEWFGELIPLCEYCHKLVHRR